MKEKHLKFKEISEFYDLVKDGSANSNEHLESCSICREELKKLNDCIEIVSVYKNIKIVDPDEFIGETLKKCRKSKIRFLFYNKKFIRHAGIAVAAAVVLFIFVPGFLTKPENTDNSEQLASEVKMPGEAGENEIYLQAENIEQIVFFLKKYNFKIVSYDDNKIEVESKYRNFLNLKSAVESSEDNDVNFLSSRDLSLAGTAADGDMYIPGADRKIRFYIINTK